MKRVTSLVSLIGSAALIISPWVVQSQNEATRAPDGGTSYRVASIFIPAMPDAPFTATVRTEWIRQLPDGSTITMKNHRTVARDSEGRLFQERRYLTPDDDFSQAPISQLEFTDPTTHKFYVCHPSLAFCEIQPYRALPFVPPGPLDSQPVQGGSNLDQENLGSRTISGVETMGSRETTSIPTGAIGNSQPESLVKEFWYSQKLGINILTKRIDPRAGIQTFLVTDISVGEPDPSLFNLPEGARIMDMRGLSSAGGKLGQEP